MSKLSTEERNALSSDRFGLPQKRKFPLNDEAHIEDAAKKFSRANISSKDRKSLADEILKKAKDKGMDTSGWKDVNRVAGVTEQVPPMSDGTSTGNSPPRTMAPYYDEQDELFTQVANMERKRPNLTMDDIRSIVNAIHQKTVSDEKPPTGNQNCQLCTWCAEAQFRGRTDALPRPVYSPRDPVLGIPGETIVLHPMKLPIRNNDDAVTRVKEAGPGARFYVHVNWKGSEGGHEFLLINIEFQVYLMDAQAGIVENVDENQRYFNDTNFANSFMARLDTKTLNERLLKDATDMSKVLPWDPKLDIPYMKEHGLLSDEDYQAAMDTGDLPIQEAACTASLLTVKNQLMNLLDRDFEFIGGSLIPKFTMKSRMKPELAFEVNIVGPNVEVTPVINNIPDILHKRRGIAIMQAAHVVADFANDFVAHYKPKTTQESVTQEGAFQDLKNGVNPFSDKLVFHVSQKSHFDGQIWEPRVPEYLDPYDPNDKFFEDNTTPRVCFSTSIEGALNGIMVHMERDTPERFGKMYVYVPEKPYKEYKHKTTKDLVKGKDVWDANVTREVWIMEPVRMKLYGVIQVDQVSDMKRKATVPNAKNEKNKRQYFTFKWHWVVPPKVLEKSTTFEYTTDKVSMWLSNDLKRFKYGLIRNGKLETSASESDYEKYWVFHSGEEVDQAGGGNCWDYVEYEAGYLKAFGVSYKKYFMNFTKTDGKTSVNTHTICVVPYEGKYIYLEGAFKRITSEWGHERRRTFDSLKEIFEYVAECSADYENQDLNYGVWDYTDAKIDYGTPANDFCNWIMSKCRMVFDGEAKKPEVKSEMDTFITIDDSMFYVSEYHNALFDDPDAYAEAVLEYGLNVSDDNEDIIQEAAYGPYDEYLKRHNYDPKTNSIEDPNNPGRRVNAGRIGSNKERNRMNKFLRENGYDPKTETILTDIPDKNNPGQKRRVKFGINSAIGNAGAKMTMPPAYSRVDKVDDYTDDMESGISMAKSVMQQKPGQSNYILKHEEGHMAYEDSFDKKRNGTWNMNPSHHSSKAYRDDINAARQHIKSQAKKNPALLGNQHDILPTEYQADKYGEEHNRYGRGHGATALSNIMGKLKKFDPSTYRAQRDAMLDAYGTGEEGFKKFTESLQDQYDMMLSMSEMMKGTQSASVYKKGLVGIKREIDAGFPESRKVFFSLTQPDEKKAIDEGMQRDIDKLDAGTDSRAAFMKKYADKAQVQQAATDAKRRQLAKEQLKQQIASGKLTGDQAAKAERKIQRIEAFEAGKQQSQQKPAQPKAETISVGAQNIAKPTVKKEGYRVSRFGNMFQEAEEALSDTEDITIGDLKLDDDTSEEDGPGLPGYIEDRMSDDDLKAFNSDDDDFKIPEEGDFESFKVSDEKLDAARGPIEPQPDENLNVNDVDLGMFGTDTSDVQNEYDPKDVETLMKLMASEADAMAEYLEAAKVTNTDVLRRLYADIANEERFHMEQLLFAKSEITGEKYEPKDPEVKAEYEELLNMGMDEETAMQTAVDRCHIRGSIAEDDEDERIEIQEDITQMESVLKMFDIAYDHTSMILESGSATPEDVDKAYDIFVEAVYNVAPESEKSALSMGNKRGPIQLLRDALRFLVKALMTILRKFVEFCKRIKNRSREIKRYVKQYGLDAIFDKKVRMYFVNLQNPQAQYIDNDVWFLLGLAIDTTNACAMTLGRNTMQYNNVPRNPKLDIQGNIMRGAELLSTVQLVRSPMAVPKDKAEQEKIAAAFFGYTMDTVYNRDGSTTNVKYYGEDGKSTNTLNTMRTICDMWAKFMQNVLTLTDSLTTMETDKTSIYYRNHKKYDEAVKGLEAVVKACKAMIAALQNDISVIIKLDNDAAGLSIKDTEAKDQRDIQSDPRVQARSQAYETYHRTPDSAGKPSRFGKK